MDAEVVHSAADVLDAVAGDFVQARLAAALAVVRGVVGQGDEALLGELAGVEAGGLLLDAAEGVGDDDGWVLLGLVEARGQEEVAHHLVLAVRIANFLDGHILLIRHDDSPWMCSSAES